MCRNVLENNFAARAVLDLTELYASHRSPHGFRIGCGPRSANCSAPFFVWLTVGLYRPGRPRMMGYRWSRRDEWLHRRFGNLVRRDLRLRAKPGTGSTRGPAPVWDRATGRIPADAPLLQTPARNLPPLDERDNPMHYCPKV